MISRVLFAIVVAATFGLSACEKSEEPEAEQQAPETGAVEKEKTIVEQATEVVKEGAEKVSEMAREAMGKAEETTSPAMEESAETAGAAKEEGAEKAEETTGAPQGTGQ
jgi:Na+-transporting methylmalonyl-CoA/oxaloacetate decarboxylase gamma subunit